MGERGRERDGRERGKRREREREGEGERERGSREVKWENEVSGNCTANGLNRDRKEFAGYRFLENVVKM